MSVVEPPQNTLGKRRIRRTDVVMSSRHYPATRWRHAGTRGTDYFIVT